jgi:hypothetical protein
MPLEVIGRALLELPMPLLGTDDDDVSFVAPIVHEGVVISAGTPLFGGFFNELRPAFT